MALAHIKDLDQLQFLDVSGESFEGVLDLKDYPNIYAMNLTGSKVECINARNIIEFECNSDCNAQN